MTAAALPAGSIADLQDLLRRREISPREVLDSLRSRIEHTDPEIGAYLSIDFDAAAKEADKAADKAEAKPVHHHHRKHHPTQITICHPG